MLDYRLRVFSAVAESLNLTRASQVLHISQPAVTQHIKLLEEHYGTALFVRSASGVTLTPAGRILQAAATKAYGLERQTEAQVRSGQAVLKGPLRLGSSTTVAQYFLPALIGVFQGRNPGVELTLRIGNTREVADGLRAGRLDLGVVEGPGEKRELHAVPFFRDEIVCVASPLHPLASAAPAWASRLSGAAMVMREQGSGTRFVVEQALKKAGVPLRSLRVVLETDSSEAIKGLVASGCSLAFLSRLAIKAELELGVLVEVPIAGLHIFRDFSFLYPQGPRPDGVPGAFMDAVVEGADTLKGHLAAGPGPRVRAR